MSNKAFKDMRQRALCGQADAIFDILVRTGTLPPKLSLTIEEILERAWEIAYRQDAPRKEGNLITLSEFKSCRRPRAGGANSNAVQLARPTEPH